VSDPEAAVTHVIPRNEMLNKDVELDRLNMAIAQSIKTPAVVENGFGGIDPAKLTQSMEFLKTSMGVDQRRRLRTRCSMHPSFRPRKSGCCPDHHRFTRGPASGTRSISSDNGCAHQQGQAGPHHDQHYRRPDGRHRKCRHALWRREGTLAVEGLTCRSKRASSSPSSARRAAAKAT
jgi:hypothetical protein